jgi:AcrR family transcriptional regulator
MPVRKPSSSTGRPPQRSNGIKRREAIMAAAAQIITETGIASLTLHATAKRAGASIGSTYHFFGDKDQLLDALREQHRQAVAAMVADMVETKAADWMAMSTAEVIDALFGKPIRFYADHPFALDLHTLHEESAADTFLALVETVMTLRMGPAKGPEIARMLYAISTGTLAFVLDNREPSRRALVGNIPMALTAYLSAQETAFD